MPEAPLYALVLLLALAGLAALALSMERHWLQSGGAPGRWRQLAPGLRVLGGAALLLSLLLSLQLDHGSIAALVWVMALAPSAVAVAFIFAWRPAWFGLLLGRFRQQ